MRARTPLKRCESILTGLDRALLRQLLEGRLIARDGLRRLVRAKRERPERPIGALLLAEELIDDAALECLVAGLDGEVRTRVGRARKLLSLGNPLQAAAEASAAASLKPRDALPVLLRGIARMRLGEKVEAQEDLDRAIALAPDDPVAWHERGLFRFRAGRAAEAAADLSRALALGATAEIHLHRGLLYLSEGEELSALLDFSRALSIDRRSWRARLARGLALLSSGSGEAGAEEIQLVLGQRRLPARLAGVLSAILQARGARARVAIPAVPAARPRPVETRIARTAPREPRSFRPSRWVLVAACLLAIVALLAFLFYPERLEPVPPEPDRPVAAQTKPPLSAGGARPPPPVVAREEPQAREKEWSAPDLASDGYAAFLVTELGLSGSEAAAEVAENRRLLAKR